MLQKFTKLIAEQGADKSASTGPYTKPSFVARVMLHYVSEGYSKLHEAMEDIGFQQIVTGTTSRGNVRISSKLPGGMYYYDASASTNALRTNSMATIYEKVKKVVKDVIASEPEDVKKENTPPTIIIIESNGVKWEGLEDAEPAAK